MRKNGRPKTCEKTKNRKDARPGIRVKKALFCMAFSSFLAGFSSFRLALFRLFTLRYFGANKRGENGTHLPL